MLMGTKITEAPKLSATTLAKNCYYDMLADCTEITEIPENYLSATINLVEGCYYGIFERCYNLTNVCKLPATTLQKDCYRALFNDCHSITTVPKDLLPALILFCSTLLKHRHLHPHNEELLNLPSCIYCYYYHKS